MSTGTRTYQVLTRTIINSQCSGLVFEWPFGAVGRKFGINPLISSASVIDGAALESSWRLLRRRCGSVVLTPDDDGDDWRSIRNLEESQEGTVAKAGEQRGRFLTPVTPQGPMDGNVNMAMVGE